MTDLLVKVSAAALMEHREVNAEWTDEAILLHPSANVGIAVAAPQGLVVPVIRAVERLRPGGDLRCARRAGPRARARGEAHTAMTSRAGRSTISNLGMFAVEAFTAVLNPPQAAIVGSARPRTAWRWTAGPARPDDTLVATFDHRAVDGALRPRDSSRH